jgi:starch synthase (maltosyl-transferring)
VGEPFPVRASIFRDGHDVLAARAVLRQGATVVDVCPLVDEGNDEWSGTLTAERVGPHEVVVEAWTDRCATWARRATAKLAAGQAVQAEIAEARSLLTEGLPGGRAAARGAVAKALAALDNQGADDASRLAPTLSALGADGPGTGSRTPGTAPPGPRGPGGASRGLDEPRLASGLTAGAPAPVWVERERAGSGAWYELFPRSFGGLRGAAEQVPRLARLGFDVLYLPPVHPIGHTGRKGRDGSLAAGPGDPGSPWAIGSEEGGHTALHPGLGALDDFDHLVQTAADHGMEVALDYALQCSPDHPWVREHPEWFHRRPDGSIAYAENPPKKYEDIYPMNFWPPVEADRLALWGACKDVIDFWVGHGVRTFRVDNPHTKPFAFWEWLIGAVRAEQPDVVLLAEAFTRPKVMARLAEIGFSQSYTYFTWRLPQHGPEGLRAYVEELAHGPLADYMRPNFWPNTPDILSGPLRGGPPAAFALRYVLAATLSPLYGIYSGYELCENAPASSDNEEYLHSEKYEMKHRDFSLGTPLDPLLATVNDIRRRHPAFSRLRNVRFHGSANPDVITYSKVSDDGSDVVLVVVTLDPYVPQEATLYLDATALGIRPGSTLEVYDELSGETYTWGLQPYVKLDPSRQVAHIFSVRTAA